MPKESETFIGAMFIELAEKYDDDKRRHYMIDNMASFQLINPESREQTLLTDPPETPACSKTWTSKSLHVIAGSYSISPEIGRLGNSLLVD